MIRPALFRTAAFAAALAMTANACSTAPRISAPKIAAPTTRPTMGAVTEPQRDLIYLPPPQQPIAIAVYNFADQTGQLKPSDNIQSLSRAVTQGATSVVIKALRDAGNGNWFTVVERERLDNVLRERQIIREMRQRYLGEKETPSAVLPSLLFAGILLEGGIIGYDTNTLTGGAGARFLAIGASTKYRQNTVTVYLRAVSVRTGEVLANVVTSKTVASIALQGDVFKYIAFDELLEGEAGVTANEPTQIALQEAIEKAVFALVLEGAQGGSRQLWSFADPVAGQAFLSRYNGQKQQALARAYRDGPLDGRPIPSSPRPAATAAPQRRSESPAPVRTAAAEPISMVVAPPPMEAPTAPAPGPAPTVPPPVSAPVLATAPVAARPSSQPATEAISTADATPSS